MSNRLAGATSPYLLQHADNPVDWYPWGDDALARARGEQKPVFLSVGYSACHWCHVMERESFEDPATAELMNREFVNIKVDREERPDLDSIYMSAVQQMTGSGGWPMSVFLTPDLEPFFGGTYFPPEPRFGMPSFRQVLEGVATAWREQRDEIVQTAGRLAASIATGIGAAREGAPETPETVLDEAAEALLRQHDAANGGFGDAPKFPHAMALEFMLRRWRKTGDARLLETVERSLVAMAHGGIWDQLGGGFARYSTDARWLVPHFEKMLYDQALLAPLFLHAHLATGRSGYATACTRIVDYVLRDMALGEGGFASAEDADSEGVEGKFYTWDYDDARAACEADFDVARLTFDITPEGNWEGTNILHVAGDRNTVPASLGMEVDAYREAVARARERMFEARAKRPRPFRDDKVVTAWNGLMLGAVAEAGACLGRPDYVAAAQRTAAFLLDNIRDGDLVRRTWRAGKAGADGYLDDYAALAWGLLQLYQADFDTRWYEAARDTVEVMLARFGPRAEDGVFYSAGADQADLIHRPREFDDNAVPAGNSLACEVLLQLSLLTGEALYRERALAAITPLASALASHPLFFGRLLGVLDLHHGDPLEVAIIGVPSQPGFGELVLAASAGYVPNKVLAGGPAGATEPPLLRDRGTVDGKPAAYVCRGFACDAPLSDAAALQALMARPVPEARWQVI